MHTHVENTKTIFINIYIDIVNILYEKPPQCLTWGIDLKLTVYHQSA